MKRRFDLDSGRTQICHLFSPRDVREAVSEAQAAARDGAEGIAVELFQFDEKFRTEKFFREIVGSAELPFMFLDYRNDRYQWSDERRMEMLMSAASAGADMIDVMGDLYDPSPDEWTHDAAAVARQKKTIEAIHDAGSRAIVSAHLHRFAKSAEVYSQLKDFAARGADVVKLVGSADTEKEYLASLATTMMLDRKLGTPFVYLCAGKFSRIQRLTSLAWGAALTFAVHAYHDFVPYNQPTITEFLRARSLFGGGSPQDAQKL